MEDQYKEWDKYLSNLMICLCSAQEKFQYFVIDDVDSHDPYDLLFHRASMLVNQVSTNKCIVCCNAKNIFKYLRFKWKERTAHFVPIKARRRKLMPTVHYCSRAERAYIMDKVAEACGMNPAEISKIYQEYYSK